MKYHLLPSLLLAAYQRQQKTVESQAEQADRQQKIIQVQTEHIAALAQRLAKLGRREAAAQRSD